MTDLSLPWQIFITSSSEFCCLKSLYYNSFLHQALITTEINPIEVEVNKNGMVHKLYDNRTLTVGQDGGTGDRSGEHAGLAADIPGK